MRERKYLGLEQITPLLTEKFGAYKRIGRKQVFSSSSGISFEMTSSKEYEEPKQLWTCCDIDSFVKNKMDFLIIVASFYGILVLPQHVLLDYLPHTTKLKNSRENIRIKIENGHFLLFSNKKEIVSDITEYFIQYKE